MQFQEILMNEMGSTQEKLDFQAQYWPGVWHKQAARLGIG